MGITATYRDGRTSITGAYIRIERIWGSKKEGWNAWVGVYHKEGDTTTAVPLIKVSAQYVEDENPFKLLYASLEELIANQGKEEVVVEKPVAPVVEEAPAPQETKKKTKKKAA